MDARETAWTSTWREDLYSVLAERGHSALSGYLVGRPGTSYVHLGQELGGFAALQLEQIHWQEAKDSGKLRECASDALVRFLRARLRNGWGKGFHCAINTAGVFADWIVMLCGQHDPAGIRARAEEVWSCLEQLHPPKGWLPESPQDELIARAFETGWPAIRQHGDSKDASK